MHKNGKYILFGMILILLLYIVLLIIIPIKEYKDNIKEYDTQIDSSCYLYMVTCENYNSWDATIDGKNNNIGYFANFLNQFLTLFIC